MSVLIAVLLGCGGEAPAPPEPHCPLRYPDQDGDGYGRVGATREPRCDGLVSVVAGDCDDHDPRVHPGVVESCGTAGIDDDCDGLVDDADPGVTDAVEHYEDADDDGFGAPDTRAQGCGDVPGRTPSGGDCDDGEPTSHPGAVERLGDGVDQDCDGADLWKLEEDFELGKLRPAVWSSATGDHDVQSVLVRDGTYAMALGSGAVATTVAVDTSPCQGGALDWSLWIRPGPDPADNLRVEFSDGVAWHPISVVSGTGSADGAFIEVAGALDDPLALGPDIRFRLALTGTAIGTSRFFVDDLSIACVGEDGDGDGHGLYEDCDDTHPAHWADCGACTDADGDGYGAGCDLGVDCDDADPALVPGAPDTLGDGIDQDCSGLDGRGLFDDFEDGTMDVAVWSAITGDAGWDAATVYAGSWSLRLGGGATAETVGVDTSSCDGLYWGFEVKRGPSAPAPGDDLEVQAWDGSTWSEISTLHGTGAIDPDFATHGGVLSGASVLLPGFRVRLQSTGAPGDSWFLDEFTVRCMSDLDADGIDDGLDCAPTDPLHWSDCGACADADGDGYGDRCDLGVDCDDADPAVAPGAPDALGDAFDQDCSGLDGPGLFDDFEDGAINTAVWSAITGNAGWDAATVYAGSWSLRLGGGATAETVDVDTSACEDVFWGFEVKRGPLAPAAGAHLEVQGWDGSTWRELTALLGTGAVDPDFATHGGVLSGAAALLPGFRVRLESAGASGDSWFLDDFTVRCASDGDGDGVDDGLDCAPGDPLHWADCASCTDSDGDGYGDSCDLGADCDDHAAASWPGAPDAFDGVDQDCDGFDAFGLLDDFELGEPDPAVWDTVGTSFSVVYLTVGTRALVVDRWADEAVTRSSDTSACPALAWSYAGRRAPNVPDPGDDLILSYDSGAGWVEVDAWRGDDGTEAEMVQRSGTISDPAALGPATRFRLEYTGVDYGGFTIDDFLVACSDPDLDGDGVAALLDCAPSDPAHWFDCGTCADGDGDGHGDGCDLGADCDDAVATIHLGAPDVAGDGVDADCTGLDGPEMFDDFEGGAPGPQWASVTGGFAYDAVYVHTGSYSLDLGGTSIAETVPLDLSGCPSVAWRYHAKRGPWLASMTEELVLEWWDGTRWVETDRIEAGLRDDPTFLLRVGTIWDPAAAVVGARFRFRNLGYTVTGDDHYIDDLSILCGAGDGDGDGIDDQVDCDPADPLHWSDCGRCIDADLDSTGAGCDLGADCDDLDPAVSPGAPDPFGDGIDADCSGFDGATLFDDFERAGSEMFWADISGWATYDDYRSTSGDWSLMLSTSGSAETHALDTSYCTTLSWSYQSFRYGPATGTALVLSYETPLGWVPVDTLAGDGTDDPDFVLRAGTIVDPAAFWSGFRLRFESDGWLFYVDDLWAVCTVGDADGDGVDGALDCNDGDAAHWSDCAVCTDADSDGFGTGCDLGGDCDDALSTAYPSAPDPPGDGLDTDCSGADVGFVDDFELTTPAIWWSALSGDYDYDHSESVSGTSSLRLGGGAWAESFVMDTTGCASIAWEYQGQAGPGPPEVGEDLVLSYETAAGWVVLDTLAGTDWFEPFALRSGTIADPAALWSGFRIRLESIGGVVYDDFFVDDLAVTCL